MRRKSVIKSEHYDCTNFICKKDTLKCCVPVASIESLDTEKTKSLNIFAISPVRCREEVYPV